MFFFFKDPSYRSANQEEKCQVLKPEVPPDRDPSVVLSADFHIF